MTQLMAAGDVEVVDGLGTPQPPHQRQVAITSFATKVFALCYVTSFDQVGVTAPVSARPQIPQALQQPCSACIHATSTRAQRRPGAQPLTAPPGAAPPARARAWQPRHPRPEARGSPPARWPPRHDRRRRGCRCCFWTPTTCPWWSRPSCLIPASSRRAASCPGPTFGSTPGSTPTSTSGWPRRGPVGCAAWLAVAVAVACAPRGCRRPAQLSMVFVGAGQPRSRGGAGRRRGGGGGGGAPGAPGGGGRPRGDLVCSPRSNHSQDR